MFMLLCDIFGMGSY